MEWTRKKDNGVASQEEVLKLLQAIADPQMNEEFENKTVILQQHPDWQSREKLRWFISTSLVHAEVLKGCSEAFIPQETSNCSLVAIMRDFLPRSYQKFALDNLV